MSRKRIEMTKCFSKQSSSPFAPFSLRIENHACFKAISDFNLQEGKIPVQEKEFGTDYFCRNNKYNLQRISRAKITIRTAPYVQANRQKN